MYEPWPHLAEDAESPEVQSAFDPEESLDRPRPTLKCVVIRIGIWNEVSFGLERHEFMNIVRESATDAGGLREERLEINQRDVSTYFYLRYLCRYTLVAQEKEYDDQT